MRASHACARALLPRSPRPDAATWAAPRSLLRRVTHGDSARPTTPRRLASARADTRLAAVSGSGDGLTSAAAESGFDFLALKREVEEGDGIAEGSPERNGVRGKGRRQMMRRSSLIAKQVISIASANSLGFVSQLWVNTASWIVNLVEVRPNLLSGEIERILLRDIYQVGDVVLVEDESVVENEHKLVGLDTLEGHSVVTTSKSNVGKVRGYTFDINTGSVESLELDSLGLSIVPAGLVSTYCLFVEDVLDIISDTIVVHDGALSRVQRVTKGLWGDRKDEHAGYIKRRTHPSRRKHSSRCREMRNRDDGNDEQWAAPMDF